MKLEVAGFDFKEDSEDMTDLLEDGHSRIASEFNGALAIDALTEIWELM